MAIRIQKKSARRYVAITIRMYDLQRNADRHRHDPLKYQL